MIFLLSLLIIFIAVLTFLKSEIHNLDSEQTLKKSSFLYPLSFAITMGLIGLISNTSYYLDISIHTNIYFIYLIGILLLPVIWRNRNFLSMPKLQSIQLKNFEILLLVLIVYLTFLFLYRALAPWSDGDEVVLYGRGTRLIAEGFTFSENLTNSGWPQFAESLYAYFYFISKTTILPKIFKVIGLFFVLQLIYFLTFHFTENKIFALLASICFMLTPELRYLAMSLKVDNVTMLFEFTSIVVSIIIFSGRKSFRLKTIILFSIIAIFMASNAVAVRTSALYTLFFSSYISIHLLMLKNKKAIPFFMGGTFVLSCIIFYGYWMNLYLYRNPLYPLGGGFWTDLIPNAEYPEARSIESMQSLYNIFLNNKLLEYFYVSAYMSFGFGTTIYDHISQIIWSDFISQIIHPAHKGTSLEWGNPLLITMFVLPFFLKENRKLFFPLLLYFILYTCWFLGFQYSRVFLAGQALAVCCFFIAIVKINRSAVLNFLRILLLNYIGLIVILFTTYHTVYVFYKAPNTISTFYSKQKAYDSNIRYYNEMRKEGWTYDSFPFKYSEVKIINDILNDYPKARVLTDIIGPIDIFFEHGQFSTINTKYSDQYNYDCILTKTFNTKHMKDNYVIKLYLREYKLWCQNK